MSGPARGQGTGGAAPAGHGQAVQGRADRFPLAAHFESPDQQYQSGKLGMWIFLVTEVLLFSGLFCAYAVYRANHPDIFYYGHRYLDTTLGGINTLVLICSSFTMAWAVRAAQLDQRRLLVVLLAVTLLFAFTFLGIKGIEYQSKWKHGLLWGERFDYTALLHPAAGEPGGQEPELPTQRSEALEPGALGTAEVAHLGRDSEGAAADPHEQAGPGAAIGRESGATGGGAAQASGAVGGGQGAAANLPTREGPLTLPDQPPTGYDPAGGPGPSEAPPPGVPEGAPPQQSWPAAASGPRGLAGPAPKPPEGAARAEAHVPGAVPRNVHQFFGIYFVLTGLHALHVIAGMGVIGWLLVGALRGRYGRAYFTPIDFGGLYWHLVDIIWIFLFPLLYLIH